MTRDAIALVASSSDPVRPNAAGMKKRSGGPPRSGLASGFPLSNSQQQQQPLLAMRINTRRS